MTVGITWSAEPAKAAGLPLVVNDTADRVDASIGNGVCATSTGRCTLRAAIQEANALIGPDSITLPAGTYAVTLPRVNDDTPGTGDHDIADALTITGAGPGATIVDGGLPSDRLFEVHPTAGDVTFKGLTLRDGASDEFGGAVQHRSPALLRLENVHVLDNTGGAIDNAAVDPDVSPFPSGRIEIVGSLLARNTAPEGGGAINNAGAGSVTLLDSEVVDNFGAPAIVNQGEFETAGTLRIIDSTIARNTTLDDGAGVHNGGDGTLELVDSEITGNASEGNGGGVYSHGGKVTITRTDFTGNTAHNGGGLYSDGATSVAGLRSRIAIAESAFTGNEALAESGGLHSDGDGELVLTDVEITANKAIEDAAGGLSVHGRSSLLMTRGTVSRNHAHGEGGGAFTASERPIVIRDSTLNNNTVGVPGVDGHEAAGGGLYTEGGPVELSGSTLRANTATGAGGGLAIANHGLVSVRDTLVERNATLMDGGGIENAGSKVTFDRVVARHNTAVLDGGGIHNASSGEFTVLDTTIRDNRAMNGGGFTNASDSTLIMRRTLIHANRAKRPPVSEDPEEGGRGGGFYSISDGGGHMENTTVSHNRANVRGGGMYHDADADFKIINSTVWRNAAPYGGGISTVEPDFVPSVPPQPNPLRLKNTIVAGSLEGGSCDAFVTSEGGNLAGHHTCFISVPGSDLQLGGVRDRQGANPTLDALADNGGATLTHAPRYGSFAIDGGVGPCPETDARLVARPQNGRCDSGAFEWAGEPPAADDRPPETEFLRGPVQDGLETMAFYFTGSDNLTPVDELIYECRLIEQDLTEAPEPQSPFEPVDPELIFQSCASGWQTELLEAGLYTFEVRAIDRAGREDPTPAKYTFNGLDADPPDTRIAERPPLTTSSRAATFTFSGIDGSGTPAPFLEYECRLDSRDPDLWLECLNPTFYSNLTTGTHTLEVRAIDGNDLTDPTPARYTWTVAQPSNCDQANITLTASADGWVDEAEAGESFLFDTELQVRSAPAGNARAYVRFPLGFDAADCVLESATLRLHASDFSEGRTLEARPLAAAFHESTLTWNAQPATLTGTPATASAGEGYREWDVTAHVNAMLEAGVSHGWQFRDAVENDAGDHGFASRETPQDPPEVTLPELKLRYAADGSTPAPAPPTPATGPTTVHCGQVLTESTLVANDLTDCPGEGLVVGASDIVVDLGGHTIDGPDYLLGNVSGQEEGFPAGIRVSGRRNVIVRNGTVQQFGWGILLSAGTAHSRVEDVTLLRNATAGLELFDADDGRNGNTITESTIADNELGVLLGAGSENSLLSHNAIYGNLGEQVLIHNADGHRLTANTLHGVPSDPNLDSDGGVTLDGATGNTLTGNTVHDTGDAGVLIHRGSHRNTIDGGTFYRNGDAGVVVSDSDHTTIIGITSHRQSDGGVVLSRAHDTEVRGSDLRFNPSGVEAAETNRLLLRDNDASDSLQAGFELAGGVGIRLLDNRAHRSGGDGIRLEATAFDASGAPVGGARIEGNRTDHNGESGILVEDGGHTITGNVARSNGAFGIDAGINVDGGGNRATGNAEAAQCRGVVCLSTDAATATAPDLTAPVTVIQQSPGAASGADATFVFGATDAGSPETAMEYECRLDPLPDPLPEPDLEPPEPGSPPDVDVPGEGWIECMSPIEFRDLDEGPHHFEVRATDFAGNKDVTPATHDWVVELRPEEEGPGTLAPETRIAAGPPATTTAGTATLRFSGSDDMTPGPDLRFECRLAPAGWEPCTTPQTYTGLTPGAYTFEVRAIDRRGHADPTPAAISWTVTPAPPDVSPPSTTIESGPDRTTAKTRASFTFASDDPDATFECRLNSATAFSACASPYAVTGLPTGDRVLAVRARDRAGNVDPTPAAYDWTISAPPVPAFVHCGMEVTRSIVVRNDLSECLFDGLVVAADGITIDLDGHTLDGKGLGAGVRNAGFDNVTITNGRLVDFDWGVVLNTGTRHNVLEQLRPELAQEAAFGLGQAPEPDPNLPVEPPDPFPAADSGVRDNIVRENTIVGNKRGVWLTANTRGTRITGNAFTGTNEEAVWIERSHHNRVEGNDIDASSGDAVLLEGSTFNTIADNHLDANKTGVVLDVTHTPPVDVQSNDNRVERNLIEESGGLEIIESDRNQLLDNVVRRASETGLSLEFARDNVARGNDLRSNKSGIHLKSSSGNVLEANNASDSESTGISLESESYSNDLIRNESSNNDGEGIYIGIEAAAGSGMLLEGNRTDGNKGYGLYVSKPSHVIKGNSANDNGSWGIYAGEPSNGRTNVDAGGNRGQGNLGPLDPITLQPQQCHLVECTGGPPLGGDNVAPDTQLTERPPNPSTDDVAVFRFNGSDNISDVSFQCSVTTAEAFAPCDSPATYEGLEPGLHHFRVRAVDASGNVDSTPATYSWTVGAQPAGQAPETTLEAAPDLTTVRADASFEFLANERNATFECRLDSAAFGPCAWSGVPGVLVGTRGTVAYSGLSVGTHTFQVRALDLDGNVDLTPAAWTWRVGPPPVPTAASCGQFVTHSIKLTENLIDCPGHGLIVGADDITIDLDGHALDGIGLDAGVLNSGYDSVTITGGQIHEFDYGVQLNPGTARNVVAGLRVENNQEVGISLSDADQNGAGNTVRDNAVSGNNAGLGLFSNTRHTVVRDNSFASNQGDAIHLEQASQSLITANEIVRSSGAAIFMQGGGSNTVTANQLIDNSDGVMIGEELLPSNNNVVSRNVIEGSGVAVVQSLGTQVLDNEIRGASDAAIELELASSTVVRGNDVRSSSSGITLSESSHNLIEFNLASGTLDTGISLEDLSNDNDVVDNQANANGSEGIEVSDSAPAGQGNLIARNSADSNGGDGITVEGGGHTIRDNRALLNGGWGIYSPAGALDGGGNLAAGNAEGSQCYGITCVRTTAPGTPETTILDKPPLVSHSRNASFTYTGRDDNTHLIDLVFECRLDSSNDEAWDDCEYPHEVRNLSPGLHTLEVRTVDAGELPDDTPATYTWEYRPLPAGVAPQAFIDFKPPAATWSLDALFTFHSNEPDVTFQCRVDTQAWESCGFDTVADMSQGGFEAELEETEVGPHVFFVRAIDFEGNVGQPAMYTWRLLGVATVFTAGPGFTPGTGGEPASGGEVQSSSATIAFEANVADASFECSLDLEPFAPCTSPVSYSGLLPGDHELRVVATDLENGNSELEAAIYEWEVLEPFDDAPPETTLERAPVDGSSSTIFEFAGTDDLTPPSQLEFECRIDSTNELDWEGCESPYNLLDHYTYADFELAPGPHVFEVRAVDAFDLAPNADPTPARHVWTSTADTSAPGTGITAGPSGRTAEPEATFEFFGTDNATPVEGLAFECSLDGAAFEPCATPETFTVEPGTHSFRIRAVDLAGNADPTPAERTWEVAAAPVASITSGPATPSSAERALFTFTADQPDATFECAVDGAGFEPCSSPHQAYALATGEHEFEVRAVSGTLVQDPPARYEWRAVLGPDTTRPDTTIDSGPPASTLDAVATFAFSGADNRTPPAQLAFECSLDGSAYTTCETSLDNLAHGPHELLVRARDAAGNVDATPARHAWTVALPPVVTIASGPDEVSESTSAQFVFSANVPGSTFQCWLDGEITDCTSPVAYSGLAGGEHVFAVLATSPAGHVSRQWEEWEWTIGDTTPPITTFHGGPDVTTHDTGATFAFTANEPGVTFTCSLDGAEFLPCTSPVEEDGLLPGAHRFEVLATAPPLLDRFGEPIEPGYDPVPAVYTWTIVDSLAPDASIDWGPRATTSRQTAVFGLSSDDPTATLQCSLDGGAFSTCNPVTQYTGLARTAHTLRVRAIDPLGNLDQTPAVHSWTITQPGPANTPAGTNVSVSVPMPDGPRNASIGFAAVTATGTTTVDALTGGPELPVGFSQAGARFYDVGTTAAFSEPVTVCLPYDAERYATTAVRLLQLDGSTWADVTLTNNPFTGTICATEDADIRSGAPMFAIAAANTGIAPHVSILSGPPVLSSSGTATFELFSDMPDAQVQCSIDGEPWTPCGTSITYTHLEEGDHEFQVQALSSFGLPPLVPTLYEWEVTLPPDTTAPDTTITRGPGATTASFVNWLEFTGADDQTHLLELEFECRVDGGGWFGCEAPEEIEVETRGAHRVEVRAVDATGNFDPTPARRDFTVIDISAPDTSIEDGPNSETSSRSASFTYTGEEETGEAVFEFECALDDGEFAECSDQPHTVTGLSGGPHVMYVRARDPDGNVDPTPDFYEWEILAPVDTTPPDTVIFFGPSEGGTSGPDVLFSFVATEPSAGFECSLDNGAFADCEGVHELEGLATGSHTLRVRALDLAEPPNVDASPAVRNWTVQGVPETRIDSTPPDPSTSASGVFTFSSEQPGVSFECLVDDSEWTPCTSPFTAGPLAIEEHEFEVRAVSRFTTLDGDRILDETPARYTWTVVAQPDPPVFDTVFTATPAAAVPLGVQTFAFEARDGEGGTTNLATFECSLDGAPFDDCEPPLSFDSLAAGSHTLRVRALDPALQPDASPASFTWTIEAAPQTTLSSAGLPAAETEATTATFSFSGAARFECALDSETFTPCTSPQAYSGIAHGEHEFRVRALSPAGSADPTPAVHRWTSGDMTPPVVTIHSGPPASGESTTATFTFSSDDPDAQYRCTLDGVERFCSSPVTYEDLTPGRDYTFSVEPTKPFLLVAAESAEWSFSIADITAPETTITEGPAPELLPDVTARFQFVSNEPAATFECSLDSSAWEDCEAPHDLTGLDAGAHTLRVRAVDLAGNADATPAAHTWTVIGPPTTTLTPSIAGQDATFTFTADQGSATFVCALDGQDFATCTSPVSYTALEAGEHTFSVRATNGFGMVEDPAMEHVWTVLDTTAPDTTIALRPQATTQLRGATFAFTASEAADFECALDGAAFTGCDPLTTFGPLGLGDHRLLVRAVDASDNADASPAQFEWTVAPAGAANTPVGASATVAGVTLTGVTAAGFTAAEALVGTAPLPDGYTARAFHAAGSTATYAELGTACFEHGSGGAVRLLAAEGGEWVDVTVAEAAGVVCGEPGALSALALADASTAVVPETSILSGPPAETVRTSAQFAFDGGTAYECALDGADWGSCEASQHYDCLEPGDHELLVRARNEAGRFDASPARHTWTQRSLETVIESGPEEATESTSATFVFSSDYPGATFECALDGAAYAGCGPYTGLAQGEHELLVRARTPGGDVDETPARHEWEIGEVPQPVTISSGPPATTEATGATFAFAAPVAGESYECSLDGAPFTLCASPKVYAGVPLGEHSFRVRTHSPGAIVDVPPAEHTWTVVDTTAPDTTLGSGPPAISGDATAGFTFGASESGTAFECAIDGGDYEPCESGHQYTALTLGEHTFQVRAVDPSGNADPSPATHAWRIVARPQTELESAPPSFTFTSDQAGVSFECALDGAAFSACTSPYTAGTLTDGEHTLEVRARRPDGIEDTTPATHTWTVDATAPQTTIATGPPASGPTQNATFTFSANEAEVTYECALDGGAWEECESPHLPTGLSSGVHTLAVRATDGAGNVDATPATRTWTYDITAPETSITTHPGTATQATTASFAFNSSETSSTFECSLDGAAFTTCTSPRVYSSLAAGAHEFRVRATDPAGNRDGTPAVHSWTVDTTPPGSVITDQPAAATESTSATFGFASGEGGVTFACSLDGAAFTACTAPKAYSSLATGSHTFRVRATDAAGNVEPEPETHTWTVLAPGTPPQTTVTPATTGATAQFTFTANEPGATFQCALDGAAFAACTSPRALSGLGDGQHTFQVRAVDVGGNPDATPATHTWTVDTTAPQTTIGAGAPASGSSTSASFTFTASESGATFQCSLDGAAFAACTSPRAYSSLAAGAHEFRVRATDAAGNADQTPATHAWTITPAGCTTSTATVGSAADAWVLQSSANQNYGTDGVLKVETKSGADARAYVRFNLPAVPAGCQVTSAKLRLYAASYKTGRTLQAFRVGAAWTESALKWSNQPATAGTAVTTASGSGYREWTVTQMVQEMYAPNANHGFTVRDSAANGNMNQDFHSREKGTDNPPRLVITFGP